MATPGVFQFTGAQVPAKYDELLVPRLFVPWGNALLDGLGLRAGERRLDVAAGPGTLARLAAPRLGPGGAVTAADISEAMLDVGRKKPALSGAAPLTWLVSPAAPLGVPDAGFDAVTCQQGLQFFPDRAAALREMRRALAPGGRVTIAVWAGIETCTPFRAVHAALVASVPRDLADLLLLPFAFGPAEGLARALTDAGFRDVRVETTAKPLVFERGTAQAAEIVLASPVAPGFAARPAAERERYAAAAAAQFRPLVQPGGEVRGVMTAHVATARR